jgi:PAS domain-containing protein
MRELARLRAQAAHFRGAPGIAPDAMTLIDDTLKLLDLMRIECGELQQRCADAERALAAHDEATRTLLDAIPQPIVATDAVGVIVDANAAASKALARSRAKLKNDLLLHFSEDRLAFSRALRELPHASDGLSLRVRLRPTDRAPFDATVTVRRDPRADTPRFLWLLTREPAST